MEMKRCTKCGEVKPIISFLFKPSRNLYESHCKNCVREKRREYYLANKHKELKPRKIYKEKNREKLSARQKRYRVAHHDEIIRKRRENYLVNKERYKPSSREYKLKHKDYYAAIELLRSLGIKKLDVSKEFFENEKRLVALRRKLRQLKEARSG